MSVNGAKKDWRQRIPAGFEITEVFTRAAAAPRASKRPRVYLVQFNLDLMGGHHSLTLINVINAIWYGIRTSRQCEI